ncbi:RNA methyltransferase [Clostridium cadaveris]|uniref:RNA methyltransferase n=1 Tax=Clostridium cadaveris TaxID=1529 RepID=UPI0015B5607C|nr:RNA methyltransferase [Clostridium cadaveris]NWK10776.1 RNA methyltransferase [Clostridium cadaveris]
MPQNLHKAPDSYISVTVDFGDGENMIPLSSFNAIRNKVSLNKIVEKAQKYKPKPKITYKMINEYILEKYSFKVHTAYIAEVKRSLGLPMHDAPNAVETLKQPRKHPTPIQVTAIKDALTYFEVI